MSNLSIEANKAWELAVTQAGKATLATANTFLDRNIEINVPEGVQTVDALSKTKNSNGTLITSDLQISKSKEDLSNLLTETEPTSGEYITIQSKAEGTNAYTDVEITPSIVTTTAGFISSGSIDLASKTFSTGNISPTIGSHKTLYLPVSTIDDSKITGTNFITGQDNDNTAVDKLKVQIEIPAGYYQATTLTKEFEQLLPDISNDALNEFILNGYRSYDENGKVQIGTMVNVGSIASEAGRASLSVTAAAASTTLTPTGATLSDTNTSGIAIKSTGSVTPNVKINTTGYYVASNVDEEALTAAEKTQYIDSISIGTGKTFSSVENNGTITTLKGEGTIGTVSGKQTVSKLTGEIDVTDVEAGAQISVEGTDVIDEAGKLKSSTITVNAETGKVTASEGWISSDYPELNIAAGSYETKCELTVPTVTNAITQTVALADEGEASTYTVTVTPSQVNGSHKVSTTINQAGYISQGYTGESKAIEANIESAKTIKIKAATANSGFSSTLQDNGIVPTKYFGGMSEGYTSDVTIVNIDVFDGTYSWS